MTTDVLAVLALSDDGACTQQEAMVAIGAAQVYEHHRSMWPELAADRNLDLERCAELLRLAGQDVPWPTLWDVAADVCAEFDVEPTRRPPGAPPNDERGHHGIPQHRDG